MSDDKLTTCSECEEGSLRRLVGAGGGFLIKGEGTDLARRKKKEDDKMYRKAQLARRMKYHGVCKTDEVINKDDVKEEKYDKLPPIAPPSVPVSEPKKKQ
jgi:hypothetical protein